MQQDIAIRVAGEATVMRQSHAADLEGNAGTELMRVPTKTDTWDAKTL